MLTYKPIRVPSYNRQILECRIQAPDTYAKEIKLSEYDRCVIAANIPFDIVPGHLNIISLFI